MIYVVKWHTKQQLWTKSMNIYPQKSVAARNSGRSGGAGGQAPCDPCGRTVLLCHVTLFAFDVIASLPTLTRPQIPDDMNADCHL